MFENIFELKALIKLNFIKKKKLFKYYDFKFMKKYVSNDLGRPSKNIATK